MQENANTIKQKYIDKDSIFLRNSKNDKKQGVPLSVEEVKIDSKEQLQEFMEKVGKSYTSQKVKEYMQKLMNNRKVITTNDISLSSDEEFILLMLGTMSEEKSFYQIEYTDQYVKKGRYKIPEMTISSRK